MDEFWFGTERRYKDNWFVDWFFRIGGIGILILIVALWIHNINVQKDVERKSALRQIYPNSYTYDIEIYNGFLRKTGIKNYQNLKLGNYSLFRVVQRTYNYCNYPEDSISEIFQDSSNPEYEILMIQNAIDMICIPEQRQKLLEFLESAKTVGVQ